MKPQEEIKLKTDLSPKMQPKSEFALQRYNCTTRTMMRRIDKLPDLKLELRVLKYTKRCKLLTPRQKEAIIKYLG